MECARNYCTEPEPEIYVSQAGMESKGQIGYRYCSQNKLTAFTQASVPESCLCSDVQLYYRIRIGSS